jgi:hypothetical protein
MKKTISILLLIASFSYSQNAAEYHRKGLTKAIELGSIFSDAFSNRGINKRFLGDSKGAIADYSKADEVGPYRSDVFFEEE